MTKSNFERTSERGSAGTKLIMVLLVLALGAHAGIQYVPVAYDGANFRQEMDTAIVKGLSAAGQLKPLDVVKASVANAALANNVPDNALIDIKPEKNGAITAQVVYTKNVSILPFGMYVYKYNFDYTARPTGYLLK